MVPKIVDHSERRDRIVDAYLSVVARDGGAAATSRAVAAELGVATGGLWHYFDDFDAVLLAAFSRIFENTTTRIRERTADSAGLDAVEAMLREILPLEPLTQREATVVVTFWGRVAGLPALGAIQSRVEETWRDFLGKFIDEAVVAEELVAQVPREDLVDALLSLATAQQVEYVVRSSIGTPARQWSLVQHALRPWRVRPSS